MIAATLFFLSGVLATCSIVLAVTSIVRIRRTETPARIARDWRIWREGGQTYLELTQRILRADGTGYFSAFTVRYRRDADDGEQVWHAYLDQCDTLAESSLGKVQMPVAVEE